MPDISTAIRSKLQGDSNSSNSNYPRFGWDNPKYEPIEDYSSLVMSSYQNANKWLDTLKEHILINLHCPYFSNIVHQLAHTMPGRFDKFGDILHTENLLIPYPGTAELQESLGGIEDCITRIYDILDEIRDNLVSFKKAAEDAGLLAMSISCDTLVTDISSEYEFYYRVEEMLEYYGQNMTQWDKRCYEYYKNRSELI